MAWAVRLSVSSVLEWSGVQVVRCGLWDVLWLKENCSEIGNMGWGRGTSRDEEGILQGRGWDLAELGMRFWMG